MKAVKLPSGNWRAQAYNKLTKKRHSFTAPTKREAEMKALAFEATEADTRAMTVGKACDAYIDARRQVLSPNSIKDYSTSRRLHIASLESVRLSAVTNAMLQKWVNELAETLSPKSVKNIYSFVVSAIYEQLPGKAYKVTLPKKVKPNIIIPSEADVGVLSERVKDLDIETPYKMALYCCMRRGEIAGLLRHPECLGKDYIDIRYNVIKKGNEWIEKSPKTFTSYRVIPCPGWLIEEIKKAPVLNPGEITDHWLRLKTGFRFHDLRHACASFMLAAGIPLVDVEKFGGWQHGSVVLQAVYTHNVEESLKRSGEIWQNKINSLMTAHTAHETAHGNKKAP